VRSGVTAIAGNSTAALPAWRNPAAWVTTVDVIAILLALSLPWSTSLVGIFAAALVVTMVPFLDLGAFLKSLKRPISAVPIALCALALIGTLWSDAPWGERLHAVGPTAKLLVLPVLLYHFQRSERGFWVLVPFLVSCTMLAVMSWIVAFDPALSLKPPEYSSRGIFVKDYIDQSQEFTLCAVALAYPVITLLRAGKIKLALLLSAIGLSFFINMAFVIVSRTALVTMPIMLAVFGLLHLRWRTNLMIFSAAIVVAITAWVASPQLEWTVKTFSRDYQLYQEQGIPTSIGERLEYWQKALRFFAEAPLIGHGTGSTKGLFEQAASGPTWIAGVRVFPNPHNQTLNVAVQWGVIGIAILYAMWLVHLLLFRGDGLANWIGLLVVVQNVFTSLFNSHIFDFHEGWMYVLGVGVAGGMVLKARAAEADAAAENP
jgi:O-antigen ligase